MARSFFEADARRAPLCLALEDVHLCEDESLGLLRSLVETVDAPFFVLCTARAELLGRSVAWARSERHKLVHLAAQTHDEAGLVRRVQVDLGLRGSVGNIDIGRRIVRREVGCLGRGSRGLMAARAEL